MYIVYILFSRSLGKFYIGQTRNLSDRLTRHNSARVPFTSKGTPWILLWSTEKPTRGEAMRLERKLKNLSQLRLVEFMKKYCDGVPSPDILHQLDAI